MGRRGFNKQVGLGNDLKYSTDIIAKEAVLCTTPYFPVVCLNPEAVPPSSFPILIAGCHCPYLGSCAFLPGLSPLSCFTSLWSCYCFRLEISCYHLLLKNLAHSSTLVHREVGVWLSPRRPMNYKTMKCLQWLPYFLPNSHH